VTEGIWRDNEFQYANRDEADSHAGAGLGTIGSESAPSQHGATIYSSTSGSMVVGRHLSIASDVNTCTPKRVVLVWEFYDQVVNKDGDTIIEGTLIDATFKSGETQINLPFTTVDVFKPEYAPFTLYTFVNEELAHLKLLDDGDISISLETSSHQGIDSSETFQLPQSVNLIDKSKDYCLEESSLVVSMEAATKVTVADYDKGVEAYESSDYKAALAELVPLAEQGNKNGLSGLERLHSSSVTSEKSEDECLVDGDTVTLSGTPSLEVFPGRPEYKSIEEGDEERWYWILNTKKYTCGMRLSYESGELYQVNGDYSRFQLANFNFSEKMLNDAQSNKILNGKGVITITGQIMFGHNANHVTPLVLFDATMDAVKASKLPVCPKDTFHACFGSYYWLDGKKYTGEFKNSKQHGQGIQTFADGRQYIGEFSAGKYNGQGIYTNVNGDIYVGEFWQMGMSGQGSVTFSNGDQYVGELFGYKADNIYLNGYGTYTYANGKVVEGIWGDGDFLYVESSAMENKGKGAHTPDSKILPLHNESDIDDETDIRDLKQQLEAQVNQL
jgi:hypothetical protein